MSWTDDESEADSLFGNDDYFRNLFMSRMFDNSGDSRGNINNIDRFDPNSPEAKSYLDLARRKPPSEDMYSQYLASRPDKDKFEPSFGRRVVSGLLGAGAGILGHPELGIKLAEKRNEEPYKEAIDEWRAKGIGLSTRAHLADTAQNRELNVSKGILSNVERQRREDRLNEGLQERTRRSDTSAALARDREDRLADDAKIRQDRLDSIDELRLRNEARANETQDRLARTSERQSRLAGRKSEADLTEEAQTYAERTVKEKYPEWFADPNDMTNFNFHPKIPSNTRSRAIDLIKGLAEHYRRGRQAVLGEEQ